jgi:hypothetical protein
VDRFRFQPIASPGMTLSKSYKGTNGGGLWKFFRGARLIGVAYCESPWAMSCISSSMGKLAYTMSCTTLSFRLRVR